MNNHRNSPSSFAHSLPFLLLLTSLFFFNFISRVIFSPLMVSIEQEMGFSHALAGTLFLAISVGGSTGLIMNGFISSRITHKLTIVFSSFSLGVALMIASTATSYTQLIPCLLGLGWAAGLYFPSGLATIASVIHDKDWGKGFAVHELAPNLSFVLAPILAEILLVFWNWRKALTVIAACHILLALFFAWKSSGGWFKGSAPKIGVLKTLFRTPAFWILTVCFSLAISAALAPYAMLPLFLTDVHDYSRGQANQLLALSRITALFMTMLAGLLSDRLGVKAMLTLYFLFTSICTALLGIASSDWLPIVVFIQPLLTVLYFPAAFSAVSRSFDASIRNVALSFITPMAVILGQGAAPTLIGYMGDHGMFKAGFVLLGTLLLIGLLLVRYLPITSTYSR